MNAVCDNKAIVDELKNVSELLELIDTLEVIEDMDTMAHELGYEECSTEAVVEALIATERALDAYNVEVARG